MTYQKRRFSHGYLSMAMNNIKSMKKLVLCLALSGMSLGATAASAPLDFNYRVNGVGAGRPVLVFNDGVDTFIQPQEGSKNLLVNGSAPVAQGPYYVIQGLPTEITISQPGAKRVAKKDKAKGASPEEVTEEAVGGVVRISHAGPIRPQVPANQIAKQKTMDGWTAKSPGSPTVPPAAQVERSMPPEPKPVAVQANLDEPAGKASTQDRGCVRERKASAFVVTFPAKSSKVDGGVAESIRKMVGKGSDVVTTEVIAEGPNKAVSTQRADAIRKILVDAGVGRDSITVSHRSPSVVGSEIHLERDVAVPCEGSRVVSIGSRSAPATIVWNADGKELAEKIASQLGLKFSISGNKAVSLPVVVSVSQGSFVEAMEQFGDKLGDRADFVLSRDSAVLVIKEGKK